MENTILEKDCILEHEGHKFSADGAYLLNCSDGIVRGAVYIVHETRNFTGSKHGQADVTTWTGEVLANCVFTDYRGNFCKMRRVSFTYQGINFVGDYCPDWAEVCKVRSTKKARL